MTPRDLERMRELMMAALDGEISAPDRHELELGLEADAELRKEWQEMTQVKEATRELGLREPPEEIWGVYWTSVYNRLERSVGWVLVSLGAIVLTSFGIWKWIESLIADSSLPWLIKLAVASLVTGFTILVVSVVREKLFPGRRDPYEEVER